MTIWVKTFCTLARGATHRLLQIKMKIRVASQTALNTNGKIATAAARGSTVLKFAIYYFEQKEKLNNVFE